MKPESRLPQDIGAPSGPGWLPGLAVNTRGSALSERRFQGSEALFHSGGRDDDDLVLRYTAQCVDVQGRTPDPTGWTYRIDVPTPSGLIAGTREAGEVFHVR